MRIRLPASPTARIWIPAAAVLMSCLVVLWLVSGCQKDASPPTEAAQSVDADEQSQEVDEADEEDTSSEVPADLLERTMTPAQFRERLFATPGGDEQVALIETSRSVVKDEPGLCRVLVDLIQTSDDSEVRAAAILEIGAEMVGDSGPMVVTALERQLDPAVEPEVDVRGSAAVALMDFHTPTARAALKRGLKDPDASVAHRCADSLARSLAQEGPAGWPEAIDMLGRPEGDASALASLQLRERGKAVVEALIDAMHRSERPRQRATIATCLGMICSGDTPTQQEFAKSTKATSRVQRMVATPDPRAVEPLIDALADSSALVREAAAQALGLIGDRRATGPLAKALKDPDKYVRKWAASALMLLPPSRDGYFALCDAAVNDPYPETRRHAVEALGWYRDDGARDTLIQALSDPDSADVREAAARYLAALGDAEAVPALISRFGDADVNVRWAAARSVGELGGPQAESALTDLIASGKQPAQVEQAAREALRKIGGTVPLSEEAKRLFDKGDKT